MREITRPKAALIREIPLPAVPPGAESRFRHPSYPAVPARYPPLY